MVVTESFENFKLVNLGKLKLSVSQISDKLTFLQVNQDEPMKLT